MLVNAGGEKLPAMMKEIASDAAAPRSISTYVFSCGQLRIFGGYRGARHVRAGGAQCSSLASRGGGAAVRAAMVKNVGAESRLSGTASGQGALEAASEKFLAATARALLPPCAKRRPSTLARACFRGAAAARSIAEVMRELVAK